MKEIKYNDNLEEVVKYGDGKSVTERKKFVNYYMLFMFVVSVISASVPLVYGGKYLSSIIILILMNGINGLLCKICVNNIEKENKKAKDSLKKLSLELEKNNVMVENLDLENNIKISKGMLMKSQNKNGMSSTLGETEMINYFSFLDKDEQVQVLKHMKSIILENDQEEVKESYALLEEEDLEILDEPLKRILKR